MLVGFPVKVLSGIHDFWFDGGVLGRKPELVPVLFAVSLVDFKIEKLHISVSSTDIKAPELSNSPQ